MTFLVQPFLLSPISRLFSLHSLPIVPRKSRQCPEEGCWDVNGPFFKQLNDGSSEAQRDLLQIQISLFDIFLWKNNQNSLSVVNTVFSEKGIHLTKNEELQVPVWFRGRKKIIHQLNERFWSCRYLSAKCCINSDTQRFTVTSLES